MRIEHVIDYGQYDQHGTVTGTWPSTVNVVWICGKEGWKQITMKESAIEIIRSQPYF